MVTGYVAWWKRRPANALAVPPRYGKPFRNVPIPLVVERLHRAVRPASPTPSMAA